MSASRLIAELRRRHVFRVAAAYAFVAWLVIQIAVATFPALQLPEWAARLVVVICLLGFPVAIALAWAFDVTPQGVVRTDAADEPAMASRGPLAGTSLWLALAAGILLGFGAFQAWRAYAPDAPEGASSADRKSIAVLPFENVSSDAENEHFADGLHDELLTKLAKIHDLKVISRTSVMEYKGKTRNLRDIGKALGVATILEGTVRKAGNRVRLSVQLIDTTTDAHLWAETFERELTDVFQIQTAVADEIAQALKLSFSAEERGAVDKQASANPEAYDLYLRARRYGDYFGKQEDLRKALELLERAVVLDSGFAEAHGRLAVVSAILYDGIDHRPERLAQSERSIARAHELDPQLPSAHFAKAFNEYWVHKRFEAALADLDRALAREPNYAEALTMRGWLLRRLGRWNEMLAAFTRAVELNPRHPDVLSSAGQAAVWMRRYAEAARYYDRAVAAAPDDLDHAAARAFHEINWHGDLAMLREVVRRAEATDLRLRRSWAWDLALRENRFDDADRIVAAWPPDQFIGPAGTTNPRSLYLSYHAWLRGDADAARRLAGEARRELEPQIAGRPDAGQFGFSMAITAAFEGDRAAARRWLDAMAEYPRSIRDEVLIKSARGNLVAVLVVLGEHDAALALLDELLADPVGGGNTADAAELEVNPVMRRAFGDDPRLEALIAKHRPRD